MSRQDFLRVAEARLRTFQGSTLDAGAVRRSGSTLNVFYGGCSALAEECDRRDAARFAASLLGAARGASLDTYVIDRSFGRVRRKGAANARVDLGVRRQAAGSAATVPAGAVATLAGVDFALDDPGVSFLSTEGGPTVTKRASFTAVKAGSATNALTASPVFKTPSALPAGVFLVALDDEPQATGGAEREQDAELAARFGKYTRGLDSNITLLEAGALSTPGIESAVALEEISPEGLTTGQVTLHVADANGRAGASLRRLVLATLRDYRMAGQIVTVASALPALTPIVLTFGVQSGFSVGDVQARARAAVVGAVNALDPGQSLFRAILSAALAGVPGLVFLPSTPSGVVVPAADLIANASTRFRTDETLVTFQ